MSWGDYQEYDPTKDPNAPEYWSDQAVQARRFAEADAGSLGGTSAQEYQQQQDQQAAAQKAAQDEAARQSAARQAAAMQQEQARSVFNQQQHDLAQTAQTAKDNGWGTVDPTVQKANDDFRNEILGRLTNPFGSADVASADQNTNNLQAAMASQTSTNAYQHGDIAQSGAAAADASVTGFGQGVLAREATAARVKTEAQADLGDYFSKQNVQDFETAKLGAQATFQDIDSTLGQLQQDATFLDASKQAELAKARTKIQQYMNAYQQEIQKKDADHRTALGWIQMALSAVGAAAAIVAAGPTAGMSLMALPGALALGAQGAGNV